MPSLPSFPPKSAQGSCVRARARARWAGARAVSTRARDAGERGQSQREPAATRPAVLVREAPGSSMVTAATPGAPSCGMTGMGGVAALTRQTDRRPRRCDTPRSPGCAMLHHPRDWMPAWLGGEPAVSRATRARVIVPRSLFVCLWHTSLAMPRKRNGLGYLSATTSHCSWRVRTTSMLRRTFVRGKTNNYRLGPDWSQTYERRPSCLAAVGRRSDRATATRRTVDLGAPPEGLCRIQVRLETSPMVTREPDARSNRRTAWRDSADSRALVTPQAFTTGMGGARG